MSWTAAQAADAALTALGIKGHDQTANAEDTAIALAAVESVYPRLLQRGVADWSYPISVPDWATTPFTHIVAAEVAARFGITGQRLSDMQAMAAFGLRELLDYSSATKSYPTRARYY